VVPLTTMRHRWAGSNGCGTEAECRQCHPSIPSRSAVGGTLLSAGALKRVACWVSPVIPGCVVTLIPPKQVCLLATMCSMLGGGGHVGVRGRHRERRASVPEGLTPTPDPVFQGQERQRPSGLRRRPSILLPAKVRRHVRLGCGYGRLDAGSQPCRPHGGHVNPRSQQAQRSILAQKEDADAEYGVDRAYFDLPAELEEGVSA